MKLFQKGLDLIKSFEGVRLVSYKALPTEKYYTIGYGHYGSDVKKAERITEQDAENLLKQDVQNFVDGVNSYVKIELNQNEFDALVSFVYNIGLTAFHSSTMLQLINENKKNQASSEFDKWVHSNGQVVQGLVNRRKKEKALFLQPVPKPKPKASVIKYPNKLFKNGSKGTDVKSIQTALNHAVGKTILKVDGVYGSKTEQAVKDYQTRHNLQVDGIVGEETWNTLF